MRIVFKKFDSLLKTQHESVTGPILIQFNFVKLFTNTVSKYEINITPRPRIGPLSGAVFWLYVTTLISLLSHTQ